ncbi:MAG: hypothetical protein H7316_21940 [Tardiphaga sp.]|nr:hypothetical protein [Tardiphaga sp.]MBC7586406.1 hypothetical protein [Tardiphaga sp.]
MSATPFVLEDELKTIHPVSRVTRWRQEKAGSFPKRINDHAPRRGVAS